MKPATVELVFRLLWNGSLSSHLKVNRCNPFISCIINDNNDDDRNSTDVCVCARSAHLQLTDELVAFDSVGRSFFTSMNDEHSLPVWLSHSTMWKNEMNKKEHQTGQCQPLRYHVHDDIIKMKWTNYYGKEKEKNVVNKTKDKNYNYFWPLNGFLFFFMSFITLFVAFVCWQPTAKPFIFISSMAIDKLLAIKQIAKTNVSNSSWIVNVMNIR